MFTHVLVNPCHYGGLEVALHFGVANVIDGGLLWVIIIFVIVNLGRGPVICGIRVSAV